jgi:cell division transport system permease protein
MKMNTFCQLSKDGIKNIWKNRMMSFASFTIVISTLFILGLFISISFNFNTFTKGLEDKFQIRAYINRSLNENQTADLQKNIKLYSEVKSIKYISKEEAIKEAQKKLKIDYSRKLWKRQTL